MSFYTDQEETPSRSQLGLAALLSGEIVEPTPPTPHPDFVTPIKEAPEGDIEESEDEFECAQCGGMESYVEQATGAVCCSECFTQSQQSQTNMTALDDFDDIQGLAARTRGGQFVASGRTGPRQSIGTNLGRGGGRCARKPAYEYDKSSPLPDVIACVHGIQIILKRSAIRICELAGISDSTPLVQMVQKTWFDYMEQWSAAADYFGKLHPELRFSFRDYFLPSPLLGMLLRHLSYQSHQRIKDQHTNTMRRAASNSFSSSSTFDSSGIDSENDNHNQSDDGSSFTSWEKDKERKHSLIHTAESDSRINIVQRNKLRTGNGVHSGAPYRSISHLLKDMKMPEVDPVTGLRKMTAHEAALRLKPSMALVASILLLALKRMRAGIASFHVWQWITNGSLPLLDAYWLLSPSQRTKLAPIRSFFKWKRLTHLSLLDHMTDLLILATNLPLARPPPILPDKNKRKQVDRENPFRQQYDYTQKSSTYWFRDNVPLLAARLVSDLGLGQNIVDTTFALMGILTTDSLAYKRVAWLPPSLKAAHPDRLVSTGHILAVIAVACKMTHGWERWIYQRPNSTSLKYTPFDTNQTLTPLPDEDPTPVKAGPSSACSVNSGNSDSFGSDSVRNVDEHDPVVRKIADARQRFVPSSEAQFRFVTSGPILDGYLDFVEDHTLLEEPFTYFKDFCDSLQEKDNENNLDGSDDEIWDHDENDDEDGVQKGEGKDIVRPNAVLAGAANPNTRTTVQQSNANGVGHYVIYKDLKSHVGSTATPHPFHPHYGLLVEHMAYKTQIDPSDLHFLIAHLDEEVFKLFGTESQQRRKRRRIRLNRKRSRKRWKSIYQSHII